jgi:hypothetical protein
MAKSASPEWSRPRARPEVLRTPPLGFRALPQSASVHADPWSAAECRLTTITQWYPVSSETVPIASCNDRDHEVKARLVRFVMSGEVAGAFQDRIDGGERQALPITANNKITQGEIHERRTLQAGIAPT